MSVLGLLMIVRVRDLRSVVSVLVLRLIVRDTMIDVVARLMIVNLLLIEHLRSFHVILND